MKVMKIKTKKLLKTPSKINVFLGILALIAVTEFLVMQLIASIAHDWSVNFEALVDTILLTALCSPLLYGFIIQPFVKAHEAALNQIKMQAFTDPVTGLANRPMITQHLEGFIAGSFRHKQFGAIILLDLDGFKTVNDTYGHNVGDQILIEVGKRLQSVTRENDLAARLGGDEFLLVLDRVASNADDARENSSKVAIKILSLLQQPYEYGEKKLVLGASLGVKLLGQEIITPETAIIHADQAMYEAKNAGKGQAKLYELAA